MVSDEFGGPIYNINTMPEYCPVSRAWNMLTVSPAEAYDPSPLKNKGPGYDTKLHLVVRLLF